MIENIVGDKTGLEIGLLTLTAYASFQLLFPVPRSKKAK